MNTTTKNKRSKYKVTIGYGITLYCSSYIDALYIQHMHGTDKVNISKI